MTFHGIAHVQLSILPGGEATARSFYGELLGLPEIPKPDSLRDRGGCWFACGPDELHLGVEPGAAESRRHPALLTDDLDNLADRLVSRGYPIEHDRPLPGYRRFYARDPFGNRIEFLEPTTEGAE